MNFHIMKFDKWKKYLFLRDSIKDTELNRILDKISSGVKLTGREEDFLTKYDDIIESDLKDMSHLSKEVTFDKISELLKSSKRVICDLFDRDGRINDQILSIENNFESEFSTMLLKHGDKAKLHERFLYKIQYNFHNDTYSLQSQDEYCEKIGVKNDD